MLSLTIKCYGQLITLYINWKKPEFLKQEVEYLGHIISNGTIRPGENKTKALKKFPQPTTIKQIQQFLGLIGIFDHLSKIIL